MIVPQLAAVKPRVTSPETGDELPLQDIIQSYVADGRTGHLCLTGPRGSGKSTALAHLAAQDYAHKLTLADDLSLPDIQKLPEDRLVVFATVRQTHESKQLNLASWTQDDLIEYLLAKHPQHCGTIVTKLSKDAAHLNGNAFLYCVVAEELANEDHVPDVRSALRAAVARICADDKTLRRARLYTSAILQGARLPAMRGRLESPQVMRLLGFRIVQVLLTADLLFSRIDGRKRPVFARVLPPDVIRELASLVQADPASFERLEATYDGRRAFYPLMASVLFAADASWRPSGAACNLTGGYFQNAQWPEINLSRASLCNANMPQADLHNADLSKARLRITNLSGADLANADLTAVRATGSELTRAKLARAQLERAEFDKAELVAADLSEVSAQFADFRGANLTAANCKNAELVSCRFGGARLQNADFRGAALSQADFRDADLRSVLMEGATMEGAELCRAILEFVDWRAICLRRANLMGALLTGANLSGADLRKAKLKFTGMADVDLSSADLREADLTDCSFHLGSSRSGLVGSAPAGHGSRTGFYTNDYDDKHFKSPEVIRKANLCGADLRSANIFGVDFYLVDLRGATYDADQRAHFINCDAILEDPS